MATDPKSTFMEWLAEQLGEAEMSQARRMVARMLEDADRPASAAQDADIQRRLRVSRQRMAEDASVAAADVHARFPGMSRIRVA